MPVRLIEFSNGIFHFKILECGDRLKANHNIQINSNPKLRMSENGSLRASRVQDNPEVYHVKQLTPKRWKVFIISTLQDMMPGTVNAANLVQDLKTIVTSIPEANFVQAALEARPFKPQFVEQLVLKGVVSQSTTASTIARVAKFKDEKLKNQPKILHRERLTEKTLKHQLNKQYHPYRFIIKNFCNLLELKYKRQVDVKKMKVSQVQKLLREDLNVFTQFLSNSSSPYRKLFKNQKNSNDDQTKIKIEKFIEGFIFQHEKISSTCHKVILYACRSQFQKQLQEKMQDFVTAEEFDIPKDFQIDGCYIRSMNSLMQFSQTHNHKSSLHKLLQFRANILKDIDEYYSSQKIQSKQLEVSAEVQIEIIRFVVGKLKGWACEIYSQLKYLELVYGDEEIAYKYEQASFMYTQLCLTFEILELKE